jgi:hypothetical protein
MRSGALQAVLLLAILAIAVGSFFLPAIEMGATRPGYIAAAMSFTVLTSIERTAWATHLYLGSFWIANLFLIASPFGLWRARLGRGGIFIVLAAMWDLLTLSYPIYHRVTGNYASVRAGYWVWEASLVAMTFLLLVVSRTSRARIQQ